LPDINMRNLRDKRMVAVNFLTSAILTPPEILYIIPFPFPFPTPTIPLLNIPSLTFGNMSAYFLTKKKQYIKDKPNETKPNKTELGRKTKKESQNDMNLIQLAKWAWLTAGFVA